MDIRNLAKEKGVKFWEIADYIGVAATTFTVWLRHELSTEKKKSVIDAINVIADRH